MTLSAPIPDPLGSALPPRDAPGADGPRPSIELVADGPVGAGDPGTMMLTCANCGAPMIERKCKLICACGYFLSCSDYY